MKTKFNHYLLLLVFLVLSGFMTTPDGFVWENIQVIGANKKSVFSLNLLRYNSGSYYRSVDSLFVVEKNLMNGCLIERRPLKTVAFYQHPDSTTYELTETFSEPFDLIDYQRENNIEFLFQNSPFDLLKLKEEGLFVAGDTIEELLMDKQTLISFMDIENNPFVYVDEFNIAAKYSNKQYVIFVVNYGPLYSDENFKQTIISIPNDQFYKVLDAYWDKVNKANK